MEDFIISGCLFSILFIFSFRNFHVLMQNYKKLFDFYYRKDKKFVVVNWWSKKQPSYACSGKITYLYCSCHLIYDANMYDGLNTFLSDLYFYKKWLPKNKIVHSKNKQCRCPLEQIPALLEKYFRNSLYASLLHLLTLKRMNLFCVKDCIAIICFILTI